MVAPRNIKLVVQYHGLDYAGWQYQPKLRTIQGELEAAVYRLTGQRVTLHGAGRTDAGVHAVGQVANFTITHGLPIGKYRDGLNFYLPGDIVVREASLVSPAFNARFDAVYRQYHYLIGRHRSALDAERRWEMSEKLDIQLLEKAAEGIIGIYDFTACCVVSSQKDNNRCVVYASHWEDEGSVLCYQIIADRFVHSMVRSLVGLMVDVGRGTMTIGKFNKILAGGDHTAIRRVAPARGLCLVTVGY